MATFSMASMTDVIFLLLIFFMVTSTFIFPTALEVNLPQSTRQSALKPTIRVYIDAEGNLATVSGETEPEFMAPEQLRPWLELAHAQDPEASVALYADESVPYGRIVEILNTGAEVDIKVVLATKPTASPVNPANAELAAPQEATDVTAGIQTTPNTPEI